MSKEANVALRAWLDAKGWTQKELALRLCVSESQASRLLSGKRTPTLEQAACIHELTGLRPERWVA